MAESSERIVKAVIICRIRDMAEAVLPCNYVVNGFCGADGKKCDIAILEMLE